MIHPAIVGVVAGLLIGWSSTADAAATTTPIGAGWTVFSRMEETAPPAYDATTNVLTLSPRITNLGPVYYSFYDNNIDPENNVIVNLSLNITSSLDMNRIDHLIVDVVTRFVDSGNGSTFHPLEAHYHQRVPPSPDSELYHAYYLPMGSTFAEYKPARDSWTRTHFPLTLLPGQTINWQEPRLHHWDGDFALIITPVTSADPGNRLRGLLPGAAPFSSQFAYQSVKYWHFNPDIVGSFVNDLLTGSDGADNIRGSFGQDTILGFGGDDTIDGDEDADFLFGYVGADTIRGGPGDDVIGGGAGNDLLFGGDGNDYIRGGPDRDIMEGGTGRDTFAFSGIGTVETGVGPANRDRIRDFVASVDKIDLSLIDARTTVRGNQAFTWIGWNKPFTGPGQLTASRAGANVIIKGNRNNDRIVDFEIQLDNFPGQLTAANFVL